MELQRYVSVLRRRWPVIVITMLLALGAAYVARPRTVSYSATAAIYVGSRQALAGDARGAADRESVVQSYARTFAVMLRSDPIARAAIDLSGIDRSASAVVAATEAENLIGTSLVYVRFTDADPGIARLMTNSLAESFVQKVQEFEPGVAEEGSVPILPAYIFERAKLPAAPNPTAGGAYGVALLFGFLFAAAVLLLLDYMDTTVKNPVDLEQRTGVAVLGIVPLHRPDLPSVLTALEVPRRLAESRTNGGGS